MNTLDYEINTVKSPSFEMEYVKFGCGKRAFVIISGISLKSVILSAQSVYESYKEFGKYYTVYLFDRKKDISSDYSVSEMAGDIAYVMDVLNIDDADVFGASQGGMIAELIGVRYPAKVHKLILASTLARQNDTSKNTFKGWMELAKQGNVVDLNRDVFAKVYSKEYINAYRNAFAVVENDGTKEEVLRFYYLAKACYNFDAYGEIDKISCPTLVIGSKMDETLSCVGSVEIANKLNCELYLYDNYSHAVYDEAPDYKQRMLQFLQKT